MGRPALTAEQFWAKVDKTPGHGPNGDCWPWRGYIGSRGYGISAVPGVPNEKTTAHRVALMLSGAKLAPGQSGCHACDWPPCCRPDHLFAGTAQENSDDMIAKGRAAVGTRNGLARLTGDDVLAMRRGRAAGKTLAELAAEFGVTIGTVRPAVLGHTWKHVPLPTRVVAALEAVSA